MTSQTSAPDDVFVCAVPTPRLPPAGPVVEGSAGPLFAQFGHAPGLIEGWLKWYQPLVLGGVVPVRTKELCRLAIARRTGCHMCQNGRFADPSGTGPAVAEADADAVLANDWSGFSANETAALRYTVAYWDAHDAVADDVVQQVCDAYGYDGFLELAVVVAQFAGMGRLFQLLGIAAGS
jgi:alkylhydroperoxidase family enzyme